MLQAFSVNSGVVTVIVDGIEMGFDIAQDGILSSEEIALITSTVGESTAPQESL